MRSLIAGLLMAGLLMAGALAAPALAQTTALKSPDEIKQIVEKTYNVQVLRVTALAPEDGPPAYRVAAMMPGSAGNAAYMVNTLTVDAATGIPLPPFRHLASGYVLPQGGTYDPNRTSLNPAVARGHMWR
ncbi:PepSY domain-containing protein [Azospirillum rugosum]|uniref:Uncharacterized protein n=1 Tax=Azospirillum rugosum TaxID=416170 RepID=A0ABS4SNE1_9PROT|nr:PepSY domain-containing protein [Azospirillum rugosum]MBP2294081.1 hypothetical protein [Azospirillum rugosum]MDQ0527530.1 hypothetical protein [Azospirillum rugosum]